MEIFVLQTLWPLDPFNTTVKTLLENNIRGGFLCKLTLLSQIAQRSCSCWSCTWLREVLLALASGTRMEPCPSVWAAAKNVMSMAGRLMWVFVCSALQYIVVFLSCWWINFWLNLDIVINKTHLKWDDGAVYHLKQYALYTLFYFPLIINSDACA